MKRSIAAFGDWLDHCTIDMHTRDRIMEFVGEQFDLINQLERQVSATGTSQWRRVMDGEQQPECKGVHFLRSEALKGGEIAVTALWQGEFYECRLQVPPLVPTDGKGVPSV